MQNWIQEAVFYHIYPLGFCGAQQYQQAHTTHAIVRENAILQKKHITI